MTAPTVRFEDGAAYERMMGAWSRAAGETFLDWLAPQPGLRWIDVGCGSGAFTELVIQRCRPAEVQGIDPSEGQLAFARSRPETRGATFRQGDAMALPVDAGRFDVAVMALVIFFVPEPARGVAEMVRVVRPGGLVAAYAWDILGGGFPMRAVAAALKAVGATPPMPPRPEAASTDALGALWQGAGLGAIATREITVERSFGDFEEFWDATIAMDSLRQLLVGLGPEAASAVKARACADMPADASGRITFSARANAISGRVPA
jgi:SAM-dependent methyltransferase